MKKLLRKIACRSTRVMMKSDLLWSMAQRFPNHDFFHRQRYPVIHKRARSQCADLLSERTVIAGPFAGLRYAQEAAVGSSLWPKLLGTYESELRPCFEAIKQKANYRQVVDVGFAEGFYLVGLGRQFPAAQLVGFDTEDEAKQLCQANATANGIDQHRLKLFGGFDADAFRNELQSDSLVVVDCEGFENQVVESLSADELSKADWLIEAHDHLVAGTTDRLKLAFQPTHEIEEVVTDSDLVTKQSLLPASVRNRCSAYVQEALVSEGRMAEQKWIFATRRKAA
ncbi:MAG: hypothetical protein WBD31_10530 [Rubripirellula sp.]